MHKRQDSRKVDASEQHFTNLYVSNLPADFTEAQLRELFQQFGAINSLKREVGTPVGFVNFEKNEMAVRAIEQLHQKHTVGDKTIFVQRHFSKSQGQSRPGESENLVSKNMQKTLENNIFVKYLPASVSEKDVRDVF